MKCYVLALKRSPKLARENLLQGCAVPRRASKRCNKVRQDNGDDREMVEEKKGEARQGIGITDEIKVRFRKREDEGYVAREKKILVRYSASRKNKHG